jgi:hypothetical protein
MQNMLIVRTFLICSILSVAACNGSKHSGKTAAMPGNWQKEPVTIDGDSKEWPSPYPNYDSKAMIAYATSNDKDNLYITIESGDEYTQMKILKAGLTVWIDTDGKKGQYLAIHYPLQDENDPYETAKKDKDGSSPSRSSQPRGAEFNQKIKRALSDATQLSLEGFSACSGGFAVAQNNDCGIKVSVGVDEYKELIWEASIPFKAIYNKTHITKSDMGRPISVCFAVKGFKKPSSNSGNNENASSAGSTGNSSMGGSGHGGMGGGRGGGGGKRGGMGQDDPREHLFESSKTWKQFGLAYE